MASILIVYGSTTGNTESVAETIGSKLETAGHTVSVKEVSDVSTKGLCNAYDTVLFGCSTWGNDEIELQDDFVPFFDSFDALEAKGKNVAVFGCGDSGYTYFCGAVDAIQEKLSEQGANILVEGLKIDGDPQSEKSAIDAWADSVAKRL